MGEQLSIVGAEQTALASEDAQAWKLARARIAQPNADNTARAYDQAYRRWRSYCDARERPWGPVDPEQACRYLESLSRSGLAPNTVRLQLAALSELDKAYRYSAETPNPPQLRKHPIIARWYRSWSRQHPTAPKRRARALDAGALARLLAAAAEPRPNAARGAHVHQYARDRCLILFGVCGALRGNDLTQVALADVETTERGLRVHLRRGKTDQGGDGAWVGILPQGRLQLCPVAAYHVWRRLRGEEPGPLFVGTTRAGGLDFRGPLSERSITRLLAGYAARAGLELGVSAHSMRRTFATLAAEHKTSLEKIMRHGRWQSADVALGYVAQASLFEDNASSGLLDD